MATAGDGAAPYEGGGAGGKFRKRPIRRSAQATPYDRPSTVIRNNNPSLFTKLMDPASRLIYAGAHRLFGAFRKRLPSLPPPETNKEPRNGLQETGPISPQSNNGAGVSEPSTDHGQNLASISAAAEISELEQILKQKTFTRSEIEHLTELLHSRTTGSPSDNADERGGTKLLSTSHLRLEASSSGLLNKQPDERDNFRVSFSTPVSEDVDERAGAKLPTTFQPLRLEASTGGISNKHGNERDNFHASVSTPLVSSRVLEEDVASPAELAKAYMGTRPTKVSPSTLGLNSQALRQDTMFLNNRTVLPKTPITSFGAKTGGGFRGLENGFTTPRSRGRSAMYSMARTPYSRGPSTFSQKGINSDYGHSAASPSLRLSQPAWENQGPLGSNKTALKRRSSVLHDDIGSGGPVRRIRQKANLLSQGSYLPKHRSELGSSALQRPGVGSQKLLLNEPEPKPSKAVEENGETSMRISGYASVPTKSTQMATKILQQLERLSPKEKPSGSRLAGTSEKSPTKLTSNMLQGQALRSLEKLDSPHGKKPDGEDHARESTSQSKDKVEENGPRKFAVPRNMLTSMSGNSTVPVKDSVPFAPTTDNNLKRPAEPPQKKRAFQMSALEDSSELDRDIHSNGHVSIPLGENKTPETNNDVFTPSPPEVSKTPIPEVAKSPTVAEFKKSEDATSFPKTDFGPPGGSCERKVGFNFPASPPSSTTQSAAPSPQKESNASPSVGTSSKSAEKTSPFLFSANGLSGSKPNAGSDPKPLGTTSVFSSDTKNDGQKSENMFGKAIPAETPTSGVFSFGGPVKDSSIANGTPASNPPLFLSSASGTRTNTFFNNSETHVISTKRTVTFASTDASSAAAPAPVFSSGPAVVSSTFTSTATTLVSESVGTVAAKDKEPTTLATVSSDNKSRGSFFSGSHANAPPSTAVTPTVPFQFGSSAPSTAFAAAGISSSTSGNSLMGSSAPVFSSAPSFGLSSAVASSEFKSGGSAGGSSSTTSIFGNVSQPPRSTSAAFSFGASSTSAPSASSSPAVFSFGASSTPTPPATTPSAAFSFGTSSAPPPSAAASSPAAFSFGASPTPTPLAAGSPNVFGSSNAGGSTGPLTFSFGAAAAATAANSPFLAPSHVFGASPTNNDQMSMEDSMAEDGMQTPTPAAPSGQAPAGASGFMFGSAAPTPAAPPSFQFGGQPSQAPSPNPFQASGSVEFNAGGSFSLGSGGGDKSGRRIVRVNKSKNRRK